MAPHGNNVFPGSDGNVHLDNLQLGTLEERSAEEDQSNKGSGPFSLWLPQVLFELQDSDSFIWMLMIPQRSITTRPLGRRRIRLRK